LWWLKNKNKTLNNMKLTKFKTNDPSLTHMVLHNLWELDFNTGLVISLLEGADFLQVLTPTVTYCTVDISVLYNDTTPVLLGTHNFKPMKFTGHLNEHDMWCNIMDEIIHFHRKSNYTIEARGFVMNYHKIPIS
jgi:hypothetical protein